MRNLIFIFFVIIYGCISNDNTNELDNLSNESPEMILAKATSSVYKEELLAAQYSLLLDHIQIAWPTIERTRAAKVIIVMYKSATEIGFNENMLSFSNGFDIAVREKIKLGNRISASFEDAIASYVYLMQFE
jgi:hypothetical protein